MALTASVLAAAQPVEEPDAPGDSHGSSQQDQIEAIHGFSSRAASSTATAMNDTQTPIPMNARKSEKRQAPLTGFQS